MPFDVTDECWIYTLDLLYSFGKSITTNLFFGRPAHVLLLVDAVVVVSKTNGYKIAGKRFCLIAEDNNLTAFLYMRGVSLCRVKSYDKRSFSNHGKGIILTLRHSPSMYFPPRAVHSLVLVSVLTPEHAKPIPIRSIQGSSICPKLVWLLYMILFVHLFQDAW